MSLAFPGWRGAGRLSTLEVFVSGLTIEAEIGLHPHERGRKQPLVIDITVQLEPASDAVAEPLNHETLNYETLVRAARTLAAKGHVDLVETFATRLAEACMASPRVARVHVRVEKPQAIQDARAAGVEIVATRS